MSEHDEHSGVKLDPPKIQWPPPWPDGFSNICNWPHATNLNQEVIRKADFEKWYKEHIQPLGSGVEMLSNSAGRWYEATSVVKDENWEYRATLIGIRTLKIASAKDLLKEIAYAKDEIEQKSALTRIRKFLETDGR